MDIDKTISDYLAHARARHMRETNRTELSDAAFVKAVLELVALIGVDHLPKPADWPPKPPAKAPASVPTVRPGEDRTCVQCRQDAEQTVLWRPRFDEPAVYLHSACIIPFADEWVRVKRAAKQAKQDGPDAA